MVRKIVGYGWKPDLPDHRDFDYAKLGEQVVLATSSDLRHGYPTPPYDQGQLGSCVGNGVAADVEFVRAKESLPNFVPSRLMIYYNARLMDGTQDSDVGAQVRDGIKSMFTQGACPESEWPYDVSKFADAPSDLAVAAARKDRAFAYYRVTQTLKLMKTSLTLGFPIVLGFSVYEGFESNAVAQTGVVPMPGASENLLGGHCVNVCGHDDASRRFMCRNSWGEAWGQGGYFTMPYDYLLNTDLCSDLWTIRLVK